MSPTPEEVHQALAASIHADGSIDLSEAAQLEPLAGLGRALAVLRVTEPPYPVTEVTLAQDDDTVTLSGSGSFGLPGAAREHVVDVLAELRYTAKDAAGEFVLTLTVGEPDWTFGVTFPNLPDCEAEAGETVTFVPSFLAALPVLQAAFRATAADGEPADLRLIGNLPAAGVLEQHADFFGQWPLPLDGTVVLPGTVADVPEIDLVARSARPDIVAGPIRLRHFGVELICTAGTGEDDNSIPLTVLNAVARLELGADPPVTGSAYMQLLVASAVWRLFVDFGEEGPSLGDGFIGVARAFGLDGAAEFAAPPGVTALTGFRFAQLEAGISAPGSTPTPVPEHVAVDLISTGTWVTPLPFLSVSDLGMRWLVIWAGDIAPEFLAGTFFGTARISTGSGEDENFALTVRAYFPGFAVSAWLAEGEIVLSTVLAYFLGVPPPTAGLRLSSFSLDADPTARTLAATGSLTTELTFDLPGDVRLRLSRAAVWISATQNSISGGLNAELALPGVQPPGAPEPLISLTASYQDGGWVFAGGLTQNSVVDLTALVALFAGTTPPADFQLLLQEMWLSFAPGSGAYELAGAIATRWTPTILGGSATIAVAAAAEIARAAGAQRAEGRLTGEFQVAGCTASAAVDLTADEVVYVFKVAFGDLWASAEVSWVSDGDEEPHQVITIHIGGITVGELIEYLVSLVAPTIGFKLDPPWDILGRVDLSSITVVIDPSRSTVEVSYATDITLPTMRLTGVGLRAGRAGGKPAVVLVLNRAELEPLSWDVLSDAPPTIPGQGTGLARLDYLGLGQRIRLAGEQPVTLQEAITRLRDDMPRPEDPNANPLRQPTGARMEFAPDGGWLIGLDITLVDAVQVALLFSDPQLYGLAIGLHGEKVGALAGLRFEILYKKVSADAGVFRVELELPEAVRRLQLGAVSLTLGILVVEVFTNGDFRVDLGFPHHGDFSRGFTVEVLPFLGRGGVYFGRLSAATSSRVPEISNGTFGPVLELGVGFAAGVGKEVSAGVLSGGAYLEVIAIFEGVFAWFNPSSSAVGAEQYHWVSALVAIHGKLYGQVDLSVLKVAVTIEASAEAVAILEAHRATEFRLSAWVSVTAEITIVFITIPLSFSASIELSFTVGEDTPAPWLLSSGQGSTGQRRLRGNIVPPLGRVPSRRLELMRSARATTRMTWDPDVKVFPDSPRTADLTLLPVLTLTDVPLAWSRTPPANPDPHYRAALLLTANRGTVPPDQPRSSPPSAESSTRAADARALPAQSFIEALLRWSICAAAGSPGGAGAVVTTAELRALAEELDAPEITSGPFSLGALTDFFRANLHLEIAGQPSGDAAPAAFDGSVMPMPPVLTLTCPQAFDGPRDLAAHEEVGPLYLWGAAAYAAGLTPAPRPSGAPPDDDPRSYRSYATFLFQDWCLMLAKGAVDAAVAALSGWQVRPAGPSSLAGVARLFPTARIDYLVRAGDTLDSVAEALGTGPAELRFLNRQLEQQLAEAAAGASLAVAVGVAPEGVAIDNAAVSLSPPASLVLGTIDYQAAAGDSLLSVARKFSGRPPIDLFPGQLADPLAADRTLLSGTAPFEMPVVVYPGAGEAARLLTAAMFFSHYQALTEVESSGWYAAALSSLNADHIRWGPGGAVPPGIELTVPAAYNDADPGRAGRYTTVPGDTISSIARTLSLVQLFGSAAIGPQGWPQFRDSVVPVDGGLRIPSAQVPVLPRESLADMAERLIVSSGQLARLLEFVQEAPILAPLAVVPVPDVTLTVSGQTLAGLAEYIGISIEDLAGRIAEQPVFQSRELLTVAHLPVHVIDDLVGAVLGGQTPGTICARTSRNLLSGARLPKPEEYEEGRVAATGEPTSLYDLTGQQFPAPAPDSQQPSAVTLEITVTANAAAAGWVTLADSLIAGPADSIGSLATRLPGFFEHNPALAAEPGRLHPGLIVRAAAAAALKFSFTNDELKQRYPATAIGVEPDRFPGALPRAALLPRGYSLDQRIELQTPVELPLPPTGSPFTSADVPAPSGASAWPVPAALAAYARANPGTLLEVVRASRRPDAPGEGDLVPGATFATLIRLRVRRLPGLTHVYELIGAEQAGRDPLLMLWLRLWTDQLGAQVFLAARPAPDAGHPGGLAVLDAEDSGTFLVRANLSTQTAPPGSAAAASPAALGPHFADLRSPAGFTRLLWEGTVVGGAGYYLGFTARDGEDLPSAAFDEEGTAGLAMLVVTDDERRPLPEGRPLRPHETCVLIAAGLDASATALWVQASDDSDVTVGPAFPQGSAGFGLSLPMPDFKAQDPQSRLRQLFSLARYVIEGADSSFPLPDGGLPVPPAADDGQELAGWQRARLARRRRARQAVADRADPTLWRYEQVLPLSRLGPSSPCPAVPGLPLPDGDPYRGVGLTADVGLGLADVLGNVTTIPGGSAGSARVPVGCTDPLIGLSGWPGMAAAYRVDSDGGAIRVRVTVTAQPAATMPAADGSGAASSQAAARMAERLGRACYQLAVGRAAASVVTTLRQEPGGAASALPADPAGLWRLCAAGYLAASAAGSAEPALAGGTFAEIRYRHGVSYAAIATANSGRPAREIVGTDPVVPACEVVIDADSAESILARLRPGWPRPDSAADLLRLLENASAALRPGAVLRTPGTAVTVPQGATLARVAADYHTTPALLATDNDEMTGILQPGFAFRFEGITVPVADGSATFGDVRQAFAVLGVIADVATIATANATHDGMLAAGAPLISRHYVAAPGDTLGDNDSRVPDLAASNGDTPGIFPAGTVVTSGVFDSSLTRVPEGETLAEFAARFGCPPPRLLAACADRPLAGTPVLVPGAVRLVADSARRAPYTVRSADTLVTVARLFTGDDGAFLAVATDNRAMPGTLAPGLNVVVDIDGLPYTTQTVESDSFDAVHARLTEQNPRISFEQVITSFAAAPGYLAAGALLSCPPARLPGAGPVSPEAAAAAYGLDPAALCLANAGVLGMVQPGVPVAERCGSVVVLTGPDDTLNSLVARFGADGATVDIAEIAAVNHDIAFLRGGAAALLPPTPAVVAVSFADAGPFAAPACPLTVALRLQRPDGLVDPDFRTADRSGPVERADTIVPAQVTVESSCDTQTRTLAPFAAAFHAALPNLRLATARVGGPAADVEADLWLVDFGEGGISQVEVRATAPMPDAPPAPRCFAIRPLYREPVHRPGVLLPALDADGNLIDGERADLQALDAETIARRFLGDLDLVLSAAYACGIYADPGARDALSKLLIAKELLVAAVPAGAEEVLDLADRVTPAQLEAARQALRDRLATELGPGYDTAALVQYDAAVTSPWTEGSDLPPARLLGLASPTVTSKDAPPYQLTAAKTALDRPASSVTFLLTVSELRRQGAVPVALDYDLTHLEHDIRTISGTGGYATSDWLTFYPALRGAHRPPAVRTSLGSAVVPIPLRAYPAQPALAGQGAEATVTDDPPIGDAGRWTYSLTYAHEHADQDEAIVTAELNLPASAGAPVARAGADLAVALARYNAVAEPLRALLAAYGRPADAAAASRRTASNAAKSFATLAEEVAHSWEDHRWPEGEDEAPAAPWVRHTYGVSARTHTDPDGRKYLTRLELSADQALPGPGGWPEVWCPLADGSLVKLDPEQPVDLKRHYSVRGPDRVPMTSSLTVNLRWPGLQVTDYQNARASLSVRRNHRLLDPGPLTADGFVYRTAPVTAPATVTPLLIRRESIDITPLRPDLGAALTVALRELAGSTSDALVTIGAWYGYDLVPAAAGHGGLSTRVPVALLPVHQVGSETGAQVAARLTAWRAEAAPPPAQGRQWQLSVVVHTRLPGTDPQPLLIVDRLTYAITS